ncbi:hypothetical protein V1525DRAFT_411571 [Lipomyces kononenkoae]|uniref:Uncharacterized protein n=1 Tax=Lipomyces kononenkoae TaxID=34357 RepID=A0ACC3STD7_LIPKO
MSVKYKLLRGKSAPRGQNPSHQVSVLVPRLILWFIVGTALLLPWLYDTPISLFYKFLAHSKFYRFSGFETLETVFFYSVVEGSYTKRFIRAPSRRIDVREPKSADSKFGPNNPRWPRMRRPSRRLGEMLTYVAPLLTLDFTLIKKYAGVPVEHIRRVGGYSPAVIGQDGDISASFLRPTFHNFTLASPLQLWRPLPTDAPSSRRIVLELIISFFIYDALFFFIHIAFHRLPYLASIHKPHHRHGEMNPQVTNQLSIAERLSLILLANFALNIIKSHVLTRSIFVPIFVYLLIEVHSGLDLDWGYDKVLPRGWGAGARKHAKHHREGNAGFQQFFCWWDNGLELWDGIFEKKD